METRSVPLFSGDLELRVEREADKSVLTTRTTASFLGASVASSRTRTVIDPATGRTERYEMSSPKRGRRYRFDENGYSVEKLAPLEGESEAPLDRWEVRSTARYDYPRGPDGSAVRVYDYYGMLMHLRDLPLDEPGDEATVYVATPGGPLPYVVRVGEARSSAQSYRDLRTARVETLQVREFLLQILPADPEHADEGFLKMTGQTELWVEAVSKTPLSLSGRVRRIPGTVTLVLTALG